MSKIMEYTRMKYPSEQRDWVRAADEQLPDMIKQAAKAQDDAKAAHEYVEWCRSVKGVSLDAALNTRHELSKNAIMLLNRVLYYQGMRNANLPKEQSNV